MDPRPRPIRRLCYGTGTSATSPGRSPPPAYCWRDPVSSHLQTTLRHAAYEVTLGHHVEDYYWDGDEERGGG